MVHLALCSIVVPCLVMGGFMEGKHSVSAVFALSYTHADDVFFAYSFMSFPRLSIQPLLRLPPTPRHPLPQCLLLKVTLGQIGTGQAAEQKRRGPISSAPHLRAASQLSNIPFTRGQSLHKSLIHSSSSSSSSSSSLFSPSFKFLTASCR
ncbi:unnamed protein product [Pleuronectes platessa]|uniref:Secreted protein n=1 Tax=Pleuronectes platessa TaxID=8262 RepID=A0A9N7U026_PLEPL|nr:unnamed protein product [Pleuronectes platessa]